MDGGSIVALVASAVALITGLGGLLVTSRTERVKAKAQENELRLEEFNSLLSAYRVEDDRKRIEIDRLRADRDEWRGRALKAERQVDEYLKGLP